MFLFQVVMSNFGRVVNRLTEHAVVARRKDVSELILGAPQKPPGCESRWVKLGQGRVTLGHAWSSRVHLGHAGSIRVNLGEAG